MTLSGHSHLLPDIVECRIGDIAGRASATSCIASMRPGPDDNTTMRSASSKVSSIEWLTKRTVKPVRSRRSNSSP